VPGEGFVNPLSANVAGVALARVQPVGRLMVTVAPNKVAADEPVTGVQSTENPEVNVSDAESMTNVTVGDAGTVIPAGKLTKIVEVSDRLRIADVKPTSHKAAIPAAVVVGSKVTDPGVVSLGCLIGEP